MASVGPIQKAVAKLTARWSEDLRLNAIRGSIVLQSRLAQGQSLDDAMGDEGFRNLIGGDLTAKLEEVLVKGACQGAGIPTSASLSLDKQIAISKRVMELPWSPDGLPLSERIHGTDQALRDMIRATVGKSLSQGTSWTKAAKKLHDGYGHGGKLRPAELPKYMDEVQELARLVSLPSERKKFDAALAKARRQVDAMGANGAPNQALKTSYAQMLEAAVSGSQKALNRAISTALEERGRYYAERIARTETARAWTDGFWSKVYEDEDVVAVRWVMSSRHPEPDICDFHAKADLYGLGPGVYPKTAVPPQPAHPHCMCYLEEIFEGELDVDPAQATLDPEAGTAFLKKLKLPAREKLLGVAGSKAFRRDKSSWPDHLRGWQGHKDPNPRLLGLDLPAEAAKAKAPIAAPVPKAAPSLEDQIRRKIREVSEGAPTEEDVRSLGAMADKLLEKTYLAKLEKGQSRLRAGHRADLQVSTGIVQGLKDLQEHVIKGKGTWTAKAAKVAEVLRGLSRKKAMYKVQLREAKVEAIREVLTMFVDVDSEVKSQKWKRGSVNRAKEAFKGGVRTFPFPRSWLKYSSTKGMMGLATNRGYYSEYGAEFSAANFRTATHEFCHRMEHLVPMIRRLEKEFHARRVAKDKRWLKLRDVTGISAYDDREICKPDAFYSPYSGKGYGMKSAGSYWEVLSMGVEGLFWDDNGVGVMGGDADYRHFVLGVLLGVKP